MEREHESLIQQVIATFKSAAFDEGVLFGEPSYTIFRRESYVGGTAYRVEVSIPVDSSECWLMFTLEEPNHMCSEPRASDVWALLADGNSIYRWTANTGEWMLYEEL